MPVGTKRLMVLVCRATRRKWEVAYGIPAPGPIMIANIMEVWWRVASVPAAELSLSVERGQTDDNFKVRHARTRGADSFRFELRHRAPFSIEGEKRRQLGARFVYYSYSRLHTYAQTYEFRQYCIRQSFLLSYVGTFAQLPGRDCSWHCRQCPHTTCRDAWILFVTNRTYSLTSSIYLPPLFVLVTDGTCGGTPNIEAPIVGSPGSAAM